MTEVWLLLNVILATRLVYLRSDEPLGWKASAALFGGQLLSVVALFSLTNAALWTVALLVAIWGLSALLDRFDRTQTGRLLTLIATLVGATVIHGVVGYELASWATRSVEAIQRYFILVPTASTDGRPGLGLLLFGLLLAANETNILIRAVFHGLRLDPQADSAIQSDPGIVRIDEREYRAGRAIGILERWLMYLIVVTNTPLTALGFIIAAKGLVRFKRTEKEDGDRFAEYLLVGTLLSTLFSIAIGRWILALAANPAG